MNRRQFNLSLVSTASAPLLPAIPAKAATAAALASPLDPAQMYTPWAVRYARVHGVCSADRLASAFNISSDIAQTLMGRLQTSGILSVPGMGGLAKALDPISFDLQFTGRVAATQAQAAAVNETVRLPDLDLGDTIDGPDEDNTQPEQDTDIHPIAPPNEEHNGQAF